jgi:hypothetical protein
MRGCVSTMSGFMSTMSAYVSAMSGLLSTIRGTGHSLQIITYTSVYLSSIGRFMSTMSVCADYCRLRAFNKKGHLATEDVLYKSAFSILW